MTKKSEDVALTAQIAVEIYRACQKLGASPELLSIIGSYGDTLSDRDVLTFLREYNAGRAVITEIICSVDEE
jgi:hypothetical protein